MEKKLLFILILVFGLFNNHLSEAARNYTANVHSDPVLQEAQLKREAYITLLYHAFDPVCRKYGINTKVAISQAIAEQGWEMTEGYRIFNVASSNPASSKLVYDNGEKRFRRYRVYHSLEDAVEDYCKVLNSFYRYRENGLFESLDAMEQIRAIAESGYATNKNYESLVKDVCNKFVSPFVDRLIEQENFAKRAHLEKEKFVTANNFDAHFVRFCLPGE